MTDTGGFSMTPGAEPYESRPFYFKAPEMKPDPIEAPVFHARIASPTKDLTITHKERGPSQLKFVRTAGRRSSMSAPSSPTAARKLAAEVLAAQASICHTAPIISQTKTSPNLTASTDCIPGSQMKQKRTGILAAVKRNFSFRDLATMPGQGEMG